MVDKITKLYRHAGKQIAKIAPKDWQIAWTRVEMEDVTGSVVCFYRSIDYAIKPPIGKLPLDLYNDFRNIWRETRQAKPPNIWSSVTFILQRNGTFTIEYGYEPVPIEDELERLKAWKQKYLL